MQFVPRLLAFLLIFACGSTAWAQAQDQQQDLTNRQREILRTVLSVEGYIDETLHNEFWALFPDAARRDPKFGAQLEALFGQVTGARQEFQKQSWLSAQASATAKKVVRTPGYVASVQAVRSASANPGYKAEIDRSIASVERLLSAAATGQAMETPDGNRFITRDLIDQVLSGIEGSEFRAGKLASPKWDGRLVKFDYPAAHVTVLAVTPYTLEHKRLATPEAVNVDMVVLSQRRGAGSYANISYTPLSSRYMDPVRSLTSNARAVIEGSGAKGRPPIYSEWRGMPSATAAGTARTSEGDVYIAIRVAEVPEISGVLHLLAASDISMADAINELGIIEETTQILP